jgi:hypothetical protein
MGELVDPMDVVYNGSKTLHGLQSGVVYGNTLTAHDGGNCRNRVDHALAVLRVGSLDVPVVKVGAGAASLAVDAGANDGLNPAPVPNNVDPVLKDGFAFNIYNNLWNTNAIQWYPFVPEDKDWVFRFNMVVP